MAPENIDRRLAAILSADVVGYSRLMGADETGTLGALQAHHTELIDPTIAANNGRVVKLMGDGVLVEFASVVDAVECAIGIQRGMTERNIKMPSNRRIEFRIGINLGDVIIAGDDIYGDGVNVAARLQEIAEPGGVCISGTVFDQIESKLDHGFVELGQQHLKNIAKPVRVYGFRALISDRSSRSAPRPFLDATTAKSEPITGGCLCGAIRYEVTGPEIDAGFCHCRMCQRFSGGPVIAWASFPREALQFTQGEPKYHRSSQGGPKYYESSPIAERGFCSNCGSSLTYRGLIPQLSDWIFVCVGCFDHPETFAPTWHLGIESQMPWLDVHDDLPRVRTQDSPAMVEAWESVGLPVP